MKKILFILSLLFGGSLLAQSQGDQPIVLRHPIKPLQVPIEFSNPENYTIVSFNIKIEGYPEYSVLGNNPVVTEYLDKVCGNQCEVNIRKLVIRRNSDGQVFSFGDDSRVVFRFYYPPINN